MRLKMLFQFLKEQSCLRITKDRIREKTFLKEHGFQTAKFAAINSAQDFEDELKRIGFPCYLKTCEGGNDGKGQVRP